MKKNISILLLNLFEDKNIFLDLGFSNLESEVFYSLIKGYSLLKIANDLKISISSVRNIRDRRFYLIPLLIRRKLFYSNISNLERINKTLLTLDSVIKDYFDHFDNDKIDRISELNLSTRSINALSAGNIKTIKDLTNLSFEDLQRFKNLGNKSITEIITVLSKLDLSLKS